MTALFRRTLGRWAAANGDLNAWVALMNEAHQNPAAYLHASAWAPLCGTSRRLLLRNGETHPLAAHSLWEHVEQQRGAVLSPFDYALTQPPQWRLLMVATRRELMTLALWCGACVVHRQIAKAIDRDLARRYRSRMGRAMYADILQMAAPMGACKGLPAAGSLPNGRFLLDMGWTMLLAWSEDSKGLVRRRIDATAGPHRKPVEHYVGSGALTIADATLAEAALLAFVARHSGTSEHEEETR